MAGAQAFVVARISPHIALNPMSRRLLPISRACVIPKGEWWRSAALSFNYDRRKVLAKKTSSSSSKGKTKIHKVMKEKKEGTLKSGSGKKVTSRKQAVAIALSEARKSGAKIPKKKSKSAK
jgi:hypothetical protein